VSEAVFGLVGVIIGALASGGVAYALERRKEKASVRQARRLIGDELAYAVVALSALIEHRSVPPKALEGPFPFLSTDAWGHYKEVLGRSASDREWDELTAVYGRIMLLRLFLADLGEEDLLLDKDADDLRKIAEHVTGAARLMGADARIKVIAGTPRS
jgi:hypothetical protein